MLHTHYEIYNAFTEEPYKLCEFDDSFTSVAQVDKTLARSIELVAADRNIHAEDLAARQISEEAFYAERDRFVTQEFYSLYATA